MGVTGVLPVTCFRVSAGVLEAGELASFGENVPRPANRGVFVLNAGRPVGVDCFSYTIFTAAYCFEKNGQSTLAMDPSHSKTFQIEKTGSFEA